ncbi:MAG TPA: hypothetical protein VL132_20810 [Planctomycetaceae bacterium]|nr:hypothetical protein [Planctomycetaceae bacterium]
MNELSGLLETDLSADCTDTSLRVGQIAFPSAGQAGGRRAGEDETASMIRSVGMAPQEPIERGPNRRECRPGRQGLLAWVDRHLDKSLTAQRRQALPALPFQEQEPNQLGPAKNDDICAAQAEPAI